ncbi:MAG: hypothetical protein KDC80_30460, partial [Saprospiraceae bacterium]|nr:hypothetical protein [Saprospiraceae bacterium]
SNEADLLAMISPIYVDSSAAMGGNGVSWATAFKHLQDALTLASTKTGTVEIWVAKGTYFPDKDEGGNYTEDDPNAAFTLLNDVEIYGGFKNNAVNRSDRNWINQPTILSGEIASAVRSYHVVENIFTSGQPLTSTAILDGFILTKGNAGAAGEDGGGMYNAYSSPVIRNCHFVGNTGINGGAVYNQFGAPYFENCLFTSNRCNFTAEGCAIYNFRCAAQIVNSTFTQNKLAGNNKACIYNNDSDINLYNTILWNNDVEIFNDAGANPVVSHCLIEGGYTGGTNIVTSNPLFRDEVDDFQLKLCSPAINTGLNALSMSTTDYAGVDRILYDQVDIGAYEYVTDRFYVDQDATMGSQDGSSWDDAFIYLQDALFLLEQCGTPAEIWIAEGTYYPDKGLGQTNNDRSSSFKMLEHVKIYGGFAGTETSINQRTGTNQVTLSGDIDGNNGNTDGNIGGNALHVIYNDYTAGNTLSSSALLDQVSVGYGYADNTSGAGIYNLYASPTFNNVIIFNNKTEIVGGGMYCENSSPTFLNCAFNINRAKRQGGGLYFRNGTATVSNTQFVGNVAEETDPLNEMVTSGGAIFAVDYNFNMNSCLFYQNEAISDAGSEGGAIIFKDYTILGAIQFNDCDFIENVARDGAAIFDPQSGSVFNNCNFLRNQTTPIASLPNGITFSGGAIYILDQDPTFNDCNFEDNTAQGRGGAVYNKEGSPEFNGCLFESNRGYPFNGDDYLKGEGGAIYAGPGSGGSATNCSFFRNESSNHGGAIYLESISSLDVNNCEFLDNRAEYRGWAVACEASYPEFINCTFANHSFTARETLYNLTGANPVLTNCILWNHMSPFYEVGGGSVVDHCLIQGGYSLGTNIIDMDPLFVDLASDDLSLQVCSPAIDAGLNAANGESLDIIGNTRIFDAGATGTATIDLGAYEFSELIGNQCNCPSILKLISTLTTGSYLAGSEINVCTDVTAGASVVLDAPLVNFEFPFQIPVGGTLTVASNGCN